MNSLTRFLKNATNVVWYLALFAGAMLVGVLVWGLVAGPDSLPGLTIRAGERGINIDRSGLHDGLVLELPVALFGVDPQLRRVEADALFPVDDRFFFTISLGLLMLILAGGLWIIAELRRVFADACSGQVFSAANAGRIRRVGIAVIVSELIHTGAIVYWSFAASDLLGPPYTPASHYGGASIIYGLVIIALAEVFREGNRLREEQSLTI